MRTSVPNGKPAFTLGMITVLIAVFAGACKKEDDPQSSYPSVSNTTWKAQVTFSGTTTDNNFFEFTGNGSGFSWHPPGSTDYSGNWTQRGAQIIWTFKEVTPLGKEYLWDDTATLSSDGTRLAGTMRRRIDLFSGTFTATKLY